MRQFKGLNGTIVLYDRELVIEREGFLGEVFHKRRAVRVAYGDIKRVEIVYGSLINGYLRIVTEEKGRSFHITSAMKDDGSVIFRFTKNKQAEQMKRWIEEQRLCLRGKEGGG